MTYLNGYETLTAVQGAVISTGAEISHTGRRPIPEKVHIYWSYAGTGVTHYADLLLRSEIPDEANFTGILWFEIDDNGVKLRIERR